MELEQIPAEEVIANLPEPLLLSDARSSHYDLVVTALGFEDRGLAVPAMLAQLGVTATEALVLEYETNVEANTVRWPELQKSLAALGAHITRRPASPDQYLPILEAMKPASVLVDVSVASNALSVELLGLLTRQTDCELSVAYSAATRYLPNKNDVTDENGQYVLSGDFETAKGALRPWVDRTHPGFFSESGDDIIIMVPGFDRDRTRTVINDVDPALITNGQSRIHWILGLPPDPKNHWRRDFQEAIHREAGCGAHPDMLHTCDTLDYREMLRTLDVICSNLSATSRLTLSPMGSKMQALGSALYCIVRPDIRVNLAHAEQYNAAHYSSGAQEPLILELGDATLLRSKLASIGDYRVRHNGRVVFDGFKRDWLKETP